MMKVLLILFSLRNSFITQIHGEVNISPPGPLHIPVNTLRNITCHIQGGVFNWFIILRDLSVQHINLLLNTGSAIPGISGRLVDENDLTMLLITVNTSNTSVRGLGCGGLNAQAKSVQGSINVTVFGIVEPTILNVSTDNNSLMVSWTYQIIPTVNVTFSISLIFWSPSQLKNIVVNVTDTNSYTFTLEGVRSCDPFTVCITATNTVGQSDPSCVNKTLPYIPSTDAIEYLLFRVGGSYSLNLTIQVPNNCKDNSYILNFQNGISPSQTFQATPASTISIPGLQERLIYNFTIVSKNILGIGFSEPQQFCTDVENICPSMMTNNYSMSCNFIIGCNYSECSYELSATNVNINGSITGMNYAVVSVDVNTQYNLTVSNSNDEDEVVVESINVTLIPYCSSTTETVSITNITTIEARGSNVAVIVSVSVVFGAFGLLFCVALIIVCLLRNDNCGSRMNIFKKCDIERRKDLSMGISNSPECGSNPSYGVIRRTSTLQNNNLNCDINPSCDTVNVTQETCIGSQPAQTYTMK